MNNKSHKQNYWKKENKKINKKNLVEITGQRLELEPFKGKVLDCYVFVTNTTAYNGNKRLVTEVRIPETNYYINHLWVQEFNLPLDQVAHGYQDLKLKVIEYSNINTGDAKYGVQIAEKNKYKIREEKIVIPKWKQEMLEAEELKGPKVEPLGKVKSPFKKIKIVKKGRKAK